MLSCFHYENITEDIFKRAAENSKRGWSYPLDVDPYQLLAGDEHLPNSLLPLDSSEQWDALPLCRCVSLLHSYSLLWINRSSSTISMHWLVHQWAFDRQPPKSRLRSLQSSAATLAGSVLTSGIMEDNAMGRDLLPHIVALFQRARIDDVDPLCNAYQMEQVSEVLLTNGRWRQASTILSHIIELKIRFLGIDKKETQQSITRFAISLLEQGQYTKAVSLTGAVLEVQAKVLDAEFPDMIWNVLVLATAIAQQGRPADAEVLNCVQHDFFRKVMGPEHPCTLFSLSNVAEVIFQQGRFAEGEALSRQTYETMRKVQGPEHPSTLHTMAGLALAIAYQGRSVEAEALLRQVYETEREVLGQEHPATLRSMEQLALVMRMEGQAAEAEELCRAVLDIRMKLRGPEHPATLRSMEQLALAIRMGGQAAEAEELWRALPDIRMRLLGAKLEDMSKSRFNLCQQADRKNYPLLSFLGDCFVYILIFVLYTPL